ncbi:hypothetical protein TRFO_35516 [Tritrichomonas foetus]|uniref:Uncharacterized protein n=1 Tax=Tritrichomonas foetus TaxID=1144522 RepID=A0A1J4JKL0_9EUKA|nr:hypothetical protein TRFO_35516 [Tritrichomonas foetus]|eukprot:OHS98099.1 hypothetical protein TRFO_35516 [Tritrichomonas foetus]
MNLYDPIDVYPAEAISFVDDIIQKSKDEVPDPERFALAPRSSEDADLKRMMKPMIDELIDETKASLLKMRKQMRK